jgi:hypothetical protein
MFRALQRTLAEGEGFDDHSSFVQDQTRTFTQQYPNAFPTTLDTTDTKKPRDSLMNSLAGLATYDPNTRQANTNGRQLQNYVVSMDVNQDLIRRANECKTASLDSLTGSVNLNDTVRCGWIYAKGSPGDTPLVSQGGLGTRQGPLSFIPNPTGRWFWSLEEAQQAIDGDKCAALVDCKQVGTDRFKGCAYSKTRGMGIPVTPQGSIKYPRVDALSAPASSLAFKSDQCPPPPPPGSPQAEYQRSRDKCMPLADGRLPRDCLLDQVKLAGCSDAGALYNALATRAGPTNYSQGLETLISFKKYQQLAGNPLIENILKQGKGDVATALGTFKELATEATKSGETALNYAAKDLCLKNGLYDTFDFCTELIDSTPAPFALVCLQKEFRRQGGQPAGTSYPTEKTIQSWNQISTWKNVKDTIQAMAANTKSADLSTQSKALKMFYGIARDTPDFKQIVAIPGIEVFWFDWGVGSFLGRRTNITNPKMPLVTAQTPQEGPGKDINIEYYSFTNLRPPTDQSVKLRLTTDDGMLVALNKNVDGKTTVGSGFDTSSMFGANWPQGPTQYTQNTCWNLAANGPNYFMGTWNQGGGPYTSQILYSPCTAAAFTDIPASWFTLTQEPDAPMLSWEGRKLESGVLEFKERRMPTVMELRINSKAAIQETPSTAPPKIGAMLRLRSIPTANGNGITMRPIAMNSWRTLTVAFTAKKNFDGVFLNLGPFTASINTTGNDNNLNFSWDSATLRTNGVLRGTITADDSTLHYLQVNMRSDYKSMFPNRFTIAVGTAADWKAGRVAPGSKGNASYTTTQNQPLYSSSDSFPLVLGDKNVGVSADAAVYFARLFDYELDQNDSIRDIDNAWVMSYI